MSVVRGITVLERNQVDCQTERCEEIYGGTIIFSHGTAKTQKKNAKIPMELKKNKSFLWVNNI